MINLSVRKSKLIVGTKAFFEKVRLMMKDKNELLRIKGEVIKAQATFGEYEKKYKIFMKNPFFRSLCIHHLGFILAFLPLI